MANARLIEKEILSGVSEAEAGSSETIHLYGASKYSLQAIYDVLSFDPADEESASDIFDENDPDHPSQFLKSDHGFVTGLKVQIETDDTLPDPLQDTTDYFAIKIDADYYQLAATLDDALAGTPIDLVDVGVGTQTVTAVALASASVTFQKSNDGENWINIQNATSISSDGSVMISQPDVSYKYVKAVKALTAGAVDLQCLILVLGDPI
jgi:hypothetical protein